MTRAVDERARTAVAKDEGEASIEFLEPLRLAQRLLAERLGERARGLVAGSAQQVSEEIGDLLFTIANWARHLQIDAESALHGAELKFEQRFERMEQAAQRAGLRLEELTAAQWDELWRETKLNGG